MLSISLAIALLAALTLAQEYSGDYLFRMCIPAIIGEVGSTEPYDPFGKMGTSPFPCEQEIYLSRLCRSNGTTEIDFLAEQKCLCGGNYFEASRGCQECFYAHGLFSEEFPRDEVLANISRVSSAECSATPVTIPFTNLFPPRTTTATATSATIISDRFPYDSAVSNYWTGATTPVAGQITGIATGRLKSRTNSQNIRYTPTGTTETGTTEAGTTGASATEGGAGGGEETSSTNPPSPSSTNGAANVKTAGGLLAVIIGVVAAL
ncbi:hypothetical protein V496_06755 [Pseudogymnoascus sp. VKM F-4515 (FW-2607)]|nr:hypothetical protein V496_06755 [Pseudogymnoascus sp. VKM F-4515 (FW-2607)]